MIFPRTPTPTTPVAYVRSLDVMQDRLKQLTDELRRSSNLASREWRDLRDRAADSPERTVLVLESIRYVMLCIRTFADEQKDTIDAMHEEHAR